MIDNLVIRERLILVEGKEGGGRAVLLSLLLFEQLMGAMSQLPLRCICRCLDSPALAWPR